MEAYRVHPQKLQQLVNKLTASAYTIKGRDLGVGFHRLDRDRDGKLDWVEFNHVIRKHVKLDPEEVQGLFDLMDANRSGAVEFEDFVHFMDVHTAEDPRVYDKHRPDAATGDGRPPDGNVDQASLPEDSTRYHYDEVRQAASTQTLPARSQSYTDASTALERQRKQQALLGRGPSSQRDRGQGQRSNGGGAPSDSAPVLQTQLQAIAQTLLGLYEAYFDPERSSFAGANGFESFVRLARDLCLLRMDRLHLFDLVEIGLAGAPAPTHRHSAYGAGPRPSQSAYEAFYDQLRACALLCYPASRSSNEATQRLLFRFVLPFKFDDSAARSSSGGGDNNNDGWFVTARRILSDRGALKVVLEHRQALEELFARYAVVAFDCFDDQVNEFSSNNAAEPAPRWNTSAWRDGGSGAGDAGRGPPPRMSLTALEAFASEWRMYVGMCVGACVCASVRVRIRAMCVPAGRWVGLATAPRDALA
jgi:hypothetical protein